MRIVVRVLAVVVALLCGIAPTALAAPEPAIDETTARRIDELLAVRAASADLPRGELLEALSRPLLGTPYGANMLIGSATEPEQLVIDLRRVDCFTYLDYVEALSRASDRDEFVRALVDTRYTGGQVEFTRRKHFFTDWAHTDRIAATDITATLSPNAVTVTEHLNAKADGGLYLPGLPVVERDLTYIPSGAVDRDVLAGLRTGDYLGAYADTPGLDVTHVGLVVRTPDGGLFFRNASSLAANNAVVDSPLSDYLATVPGIIVLRPR
ncbi:DUF1460 domain-containing protein [Nocardia higoensis]|uniref:DUF1460 domain-containing protein n=1 Tax=Nocardia higoensis TaxID=228599 RepID=A0ABS0DHT3_9NOCA|nr:DUF1460 domain-containing protein [Nocardia higoensis]MBF6356248.1 DUF1460 domain-containing protein [Nocardia higoensis]